MEKFIMNIEEKNKMYEDTSWLKIMQLLEEIGWERVIFIDHSTSNLVRDLGRVDQEEEKIRLNNLIKSNYGIPQKGLH